VGLTVLFAFVGPWLVTLKQPRPELRAQAAKLARAEGVAGIPLRVEKVHDVTTSPNAYSFGLGPSRRVVLWDTIARFPRDQVEVTLAHEYAHQARRHIPKTIGWLALLILPAGLLVMLLTRARGGLRAPEAIPVALFVVVVLQLVATPLQNAASRRYEAEADWQALQTTRNPGAMTALFRHFVSAGLADPDPPGWYHWFFDNHPSAVERVAMARAWAARQR
jgi:STE24 endopeptidase